MDHESLCCFVADFMNLVHACEYKGVTFEPLDGFTLQDCRESINEALRQLGYDAEAVWTSDVELCLG